MTDYRLLQEQLHALIHDVPHQTASLANASALLFDALNHTNWAGFYLLEGDTLVLNAFQGKPACIEIPLGRGVCGSAAAQDKTLRIENVHDFAGHIACDSASSSEIVIPLHSGGKVCGVLDIDSPLIGRFTEEDQAGLEGCAAILERELF